MDGVTDVKVLYILSKDYDVIRKIATRVIPLDAKELEQYQTEVSTVVKRFKKTTQTVQNYFDSIRIMYDRFHRAMKESNEAINTKIHKVLDELANSLKDKYPSKTGTEPEKATDSGIEESLPSVSDLESSVDNSVIELDTYTASTDSETDDAHLRENLGLLKRKIEIISKIKRKHRPQARTESGTNREEHLKDAGKQNKANGPISSATKPGSARKGSQSGTTEKLKKANDRSTIMKVSSSRERQSGRETNTVRSINNPPMPRSGVIIRLQALKSLQQIEYERKAIDEFLLKTDNVIKMVKEGLDIGKQDVEDFNKIQYRIENSKAAMEQKTYEDEKNDKQGENKCQKSDTLETELTFSKERVKKDEEVNDKENLAENNDADKWNRDEEKKISVEVELKDKVNMQEEKHNNLNQNDAELSLLVNVTDLSSGQHDHRKRQDEIRMMVDGDSIKKKEVDEERIKREREAEEERSRLEREAEESRLQQERIKEEQRLQQEQEEKKRLQQLEEEEERIRQQEREMEENRLKMEKDLEEIKFKEARNKAKEEEERKLKRNAIQAKINAEREHWKEKILHDGIEDVETSERTQFTIMRGPDELLKKKSVTSSLSNAPQLESSGSPFELHEKMASHFVEIKAEERIECGAQIFVEAIKINDDSTTVVKVAIDGETWEEMPTLNLTVTTGDRQTKHLVGAEFTDFQTLSMVVAARNKTENFVVKDKEITIKCKVDSNIRVTIPAKSFDEAETNVRLSVRRMIDSDLKKAKVLHDGCHNITSISPVLSLHCQNKCNKYLKFRFSKLAGDTNKTKQVGVMWCTGEKWECAGESNEIVVKANKNDYCCFLIRIAKDASLQNILTAAQQLLVHSTETLSQMLCVQKLSEPSTLRVECVPIERVSERLAELDQKGYSLNPNVSPELCVKDGENIAIKCTGNIKLDPQINGEVVLTFRTYMNMTSSDFRIRPKDRSSQANQDDYTGDLVYTILRGNECKTRLSGAIVLKIPKKLSLTTHTVDSEASEASPKGAREKRGKHVNETAEKNLEQNAHIDTA